MKKYFRWLVVFYFTFFIHSFAYGQEKSPAHNKSFSEFNIRTHLSSWLDYDAGVSLGLGYRWSDRFSVSVEPTWIFFNAFVTEPDSRIDPSGIRVRADLKYYITKRVARKPEFFISPELHFKHVSTKKEDQFGINCQNGQCAFFQQAIYTEVKEEWGAMLKAGLITPFPFVNNQRWFLEFYGGLGAKTLQFREINLPVGGSFINPPSRDFLNLNTVGERNTVSRPMLPSGIRVFFIIDP